MNIKNRYFIKLLVFFDSLGLIDMYEGFFSYENANFVGINNLQERVVEDVSFSGATFSACNIKKTLFRGCNLNNVVFAWCDINEIEFDARTKRNAMYSYFSIIGGRRIFSFFDWED